jgi:hypothetical protein
MEMGPKTNPDPIAELKSFMESSMSELKVMFESLRSELAVKSAEVTQLHDKVAVLEEKVAKQDGEIAELKHLTTMAEQATRGSAVRIFGVAPLREEIEALGDAKAIAKKSYDRVIKPILQAAKAKGAIDAVPQFNNCIETAYFAGKSSVDAQGRNLPPPIVVIFNNKAMRDVVMRHKKNNIPPVMAAEKAAGVNRIVVVEDLVPVVHKKVKELMSNDAFEKVWTINGNIRFTVPGDNTVRRVPSPYSSIPDILSSK